jgi:hypothetical protein
MGQDRVAVLNNTLWRTRFGADPGIVGRQLILNGAPYSIIGVASTDLSVPSEPDLWVPQVINQTTARRNSRYLAVIGRLRPGFTRGQAQAEMSSIARSLLFEVDARDPATFGVVGLTIALIGVAASYAPARRAATADPLIVLRAE